jgi:hypothetical protein
LTRRSNLSSKERLNPEVDEVEVEEEDILEGDIIGDLTAGESSLGGDLAIAIG